MTPRTIMPTDPDGVASSVDRTPIGYWTIGHGPAILVVHGLGTDHDRWRLFAEHLASRYRVCLMDRRGRNGSGDTLPYDIQREVEDVCAVVGDIGPSVVLGHSFGGPLAMAAAGYSDLVRGVINYEGWPSTEGPIPQDLIDRIQERVNAGDDEGAYFLDDPPEVIAEVKAEPMWTSRVAAAYTVPRELIAWDRHLDDRPGIRSGVPHLFLMGSLNEPTHREEAQRLVWTAQRAAMAVIDGQGHQAHREAPALMAQVIEPFLQSLGPLYSAR